MSLAGTRLLPWILCVATACRVSQDRLRVVSGEGGGSGHMEPDDRIWQHRLHRWACLCPDTLRGQGLNHLSSNFLFPNTSFEECGDAPSRYQNPCWEQRGGQQKIALLLCRGDGGRKGLYLELTVRMPWYLSNI